ncbi:unnamed protein product [Allacma fusca]|uniref:Uncharacterized protein n=1 Tax=Allacma fusca TaxID=39272 RepID=A0A8J2PWQ8_9HEXA|nr:unnamed protein product [Allacma fusca]
MYTKWCIVKIAFVLSLTTRYAWGQSPFIGPFEEAKYIALDATEDLLPNPNMVVDIAKAIVIIRAQYLLVSKVRNNGDWFLGKLRVYNYSEDVLAKLQQSPYGPVESVFDGEDNTTIVTFMQPYNPVLLAERLRAELEINSEPIWKTGPDYGEIKYDPEENTFTFRQGLANCGIDCNRNRYWVFKFQYDHAIPVSQYMTDVPIINRPRTNKR